MKKIISLLTVLSIMCTVFFTGTSYADSNIDNVETDKAKVITGTAMEQTIKDIQVNDKLGDTDKVKQIVESFLTAKLLVEHHYDNFNFASIQNNQNNGNYNINFFNKKVKLWNEMQKFHKNYKTDDKITYTFSDIAVSDDKASVKVIQLYEFRYVGSNQEEPSAMKTAFEINLVKNSKKWLIDSIISNENFYQVNYKTDFDYDSKLKEFTTPVKPLTKEEKDKIKADEQNMLSIMSTYSIVGYDPGAASGYAHTYWQNYNPNFPNLNGSGGDCQNFASQCVSAGFGYRQQTSGSGSWYCYPNGSGYSYDTNYRWTYTLTFESYVRTSTSSQQGLLGYVPTNNNISYTQRGDVIHGKGAAGDYQHAVFVNYVDPLESNPIDAIRITGHNPDCLDVKLIDVFGANNLTKFKNMRITGFVE